MRSRDLPLWQELTGPEARRLAGRDPVIVLPMGAVEQHGPHLPLSTDLEIAGGLLEAAWRLLPADFVGAVLPAQALGASDEHLSFAGTLSLSTRTLEDVVRRTGVSLACHGIRRLVLLNAHGGNRAVVDGAALRLRRECGMLVVKASVFRLPPPRPLPLPEAEWRHGLHAGAVETAMMLHLRPDLVRQELVTEAPSLGAELEGTLRRVGPEGDAPFAWLAGDLHPSGATGDPRLATPELGRTLVAHYARVLAEVLQDTAVFPIERLP